MNMSGDALPMRGASGGLLRWLLAATIALLPVQFETPFDTRFAPSDLFLILTLGLGVGVWRGVRSAWSVWHFGLLGLLFVWGLAKSATVGAVTQFDLVKLGGLILLFSFYVCLTTLADGWGDLRRFLRVFVVSVTLQNTASCAAFFWCNYTNSDNPWLLMLLSGNVDRLAGMLVDANAYGGMLTVAFAIALLDSDSKEPLLPRWLRIAMLLSLSIGLLLSSSRSAWLGVAFLMLFAVLQNPRLLLAIPILVAGALAAVAYFLGPEGFEGMLAISGRQNTIDERVEIGQNALQMYLEHPWFGGGVGAFYAEHDIIVHNSALWFLAEFGTIGFVIFAAFVCWFCVKGLAAYRISAPDRRPLLAGLLAAHLAMIGFSLGIEAFYQRSWWLVMGLLAAACVLTTRAQPSGERLQTIGPSPSDLCENSPPDPQPA